GRRSVVGLWGMRLWNVDTSYANWTNAHVYCGCYDIQWIELSWEFVLCSALSGGLGWRSPLGRLDFLVWRMFGVEAGEVDSTDVEELIHRRLMSWRLQRMNGVRGRLGGITRVYEASLVFDVKLFHVTVSSNVSQRQ
ncbi:hypothetical protein CBL_21187, partial [Carabus blaptoides fortunei]